LAANISFIGYFFSKLTTRLSAGEIVGRRKKLGEDSSEQIVTTFIECVRDLGLERASIGEVGIRIGLD
jgi:hypothetical protein